jgi:membrane protein
LLSIAPLIIIAVAVAGTVLGRGAARNEVLSLVSQTMGASAGETVAQWVDEAAAAGGVASVIGFLVLLYAASRLGNQLRVALNQVWNVDEPLAAGFKAAIRNYVRRRLFAFLFVLAAGPLLLAVFASRALLSGLHEVLFRDTPLAGALVQLGQLSFSFLIVAAISAVVFKYVPDTNMGWRPIVRGAVLTSLLFNVGNALVGLYLGRATVSQAYGAAGSAVVVLLWLYFSAQMFLFGAELTQVHARHFGRDLSRVEEEELVRVEHGEGAA